MRRIGPSRVPLASGLVALVLALGPGAGLGAELAHAAPAPSPQAPTEDGHVSNDTIAPVSIRPPEARPKTGTLTVDSTAHGARLVAEALDAPTAELAPGEAVDLGALPVSARLEPGRWRLRTEGPGYQPWSEDITIVAGESTELQAEPELIEGAWLDVRASDEASEGAEVLLDGEELCALPCRELVEPGHYTLAIRKRRSKPLEFPLSLAQADELSLDVRLQPSTSRAPALLTGALALTTLTVGVTFTALAASTRRELVTELGDHVQYDSADPRLENGRRDAIVAGAMYGATAAIGALTLYYLLRQPGVASRADKRRRSLARLPHRGRPQLSPRLGPTQLGLELSVSF